VNYKSGIADLSALRRIQSIVDYIDEQGLSPNMETLFFKAVRLLGDLFIWVNGSTTAKLIMSKIIQQST